MFSLFFGSKLTTRQIIKQIIFAMYAISSSYFTWKAICCILDNDSPIVCVLTQSMEPGYRRGDILLLGSRSRDGIRPFAVGDTAVWSVKEGTIPIVHRVIKENIITNECLTKGDNNKGNDIPLYKPGQQMLHPSEMQTTVLGYLPFFGMPTIWSSSIPGAKYAVIVITGLYYFSVRE